MNSQRMRTDLAALTISEKADVRGAMLAIDRGRLGIALVVDEQRRLVGVVTDGDLRRAILRGIPLDAPLSENMSRHFLFVRDCASAVTAVELMQLKGIRQVPVLDQEGALIGLYYLADILGHARPNWAVVMAGGEGRRLRPLTSEMPKPMLPVGDRPLLEDIVSLLVSHGFRQLFLSVNYLADQIENYFRDGSEFGCQISYIKEEQALGTAGALSLLRARPADPILVINGDLLTDVDLSALVDFHSCSCAVATQCIREYLVQIPFGVVEFKDGYVTGTSEKPVSKIYINAGIYMISPQVLELIPCKTEMTMPDLLNQVRLKGCRVAAFPIRERWTDIGRPEEYHWARENWFSDGRK